MAKVVVSRSPSWGRGSNGLGAAVAACLAVGWAIFGHRSSPPPRFSDGSQTVAPTEDAFTPVVQSATWSRMVDDGAAVVDAICRLASKLTWSKRIAAARSRSTCHGRNAVIPVPGREVNPAVSLGSAAAAAVMALSYNPWVFFRYSSRSFVGSAAAGDRSSPIPARPVAGKG